MSRPLTERLGLPVMENDIESFIVRRRLKVGGNGVEFVLCGPFCVRR